MAIQWFPGHMHLTRQAIMERVKEIDVVIEVLDARLPGSSANPLLLEMTGHKPRLKILNKQDLADAAQTKAWLDWYNAQSETRAIALDASEPAPTKRLIEQCKLLAPSRGGMAKPMRVLICGVPNVGKSTLINSMSGKTQAKTGNEAGITKIEQRIVLADDFYLWDTPGMLWPRIIVEKSGFNLAASGAVGRNAYDEELVALELLIYLQKNYAALLDARYRLGLDAAEIGALHDDELLTLIGKKRGAVMSGGRVNLQKAAELVLTDFRDAILGRITLETPAEFEAWLAAGQIKDAERQAKKDAIAAKKRRPPRPPREEGSAAKPAAKPAVKAVPKPAAKPEAKAAPKPGAKTASRPTAPRPVKLAAAKPRKSRAR
ncbi:ribosome biogenesis GTPase YlqF [Comamonas sp. lk]|uniref:ribosome biogenesis GTPase YlqF n=1 Tax=Comamonas sp. lk TaxID=2201272 RepID=UPI001F089D96|nr:ribosome biogenesis GTPase YlqF [Comamonas sp. lk]